jgi:predicted transcriptional regulator
MKKNDIFKTKLASTVDKDMEAYIKQHICVLPELESLIPPLSTEEHKLLEASIAQEGCRESLILWKQDDEHYILVDGHNRHSMCKLLGKPFNIKVQESLTNLDAVKDWMILNQLGKRNVTNETKSYLRGLQYKREKQSHGGDRKSSSQNDLLNEKHPLGTTERLAEQHKVSPKTIQRDERYAEMIDNLVGENKDLKWKILSKKIQVPKTTLEKIAKQMPDSMPKIGQLVHELNDFDMAIKQFLPVDTQNNQETEIQQLVASLQKSIKGKNKVEAEKVLQQLAEKIKTW